MRVLLVGNERSTTRMLLKGLREEAHAGDVMHDVVAADARFAEADHDIHLLERVPNRHRPLPSSHASPTPPPSTSQPKPSHTRLGIATVSRLPWRLGRCPRA